MFSKIAKKRIRGCCCICNVKNYSILDCHRIIPGSKYTDWGTIVTCSNCHRKIHSDQIIIVGKYKSTGGDVLEYKILNDVNEFEVKICNC